MAKKNQKPKKSFKNEEALDLDEIDRCKLEYNLLVHANRAKILLSDEEDGGRNQEDEYEDEDEEIMGLALDSDENEEEEEGEERDDFDEEDFDGENSETDEKVDLKAWGKQKKQYYSADVNAEKEEEEEARRMQKMRAELLKEQDFGDDAFLTSSAVNDFEADDEDVEQIEKDLSSLSKEEKLAILEKHSPEMMTLLKELKDSLAVVRNELEPILEKTKDLPASKGLGFLQLKYHLLLNYCTNITFYLMLKCDGKRIENHPVIDQLVKIRLLLDKMKPVEAKMKYQIEKYLKMADGDLSSIDDSLKMKANPANFAEDEDEEEQDGVYRAPKVAPVYYDEDPSKESKKKKKEDRMAINSRKSRLLKELGEEFSERPEEIIDAIQEEDADLKEKFDYEEDNFMRFTLSKKELAKMKKTKRFVDELDELGDFGDIGREENQDDEAVDNNALSKYLTKLQKGKSKKLKRSGDEDLPFEKDGKSKKFHSNDNQDDQGDDFEPEENEYYDAMKKSKSNSKQQKPKKPVSFAPVEDLDQNQKRPASYKMLKNKGLTPHRPNEVRNPRVKQRSRFEKASKKLKSFKPVASSSGPYTGQHTGIKKNLARSVKF